MMIDVYAHVMPKKYLEAMESKGAGNLVPAKAVKAYPTLVDLDARFRWMDRYDGLLQVISIGPPSPEDLGDTKVAVELAKIANDEMAELVFKYPDRFAAAIACLPMNDIDESVKEIDRAMTGLAFRGIQMMSSINKQPPNAPVFDPIYAKMSQYDLPIFLHPHVAGTPPVYANEKETKYLVATIYGWVYLTTMAMTYIAAGGVFDKYPNLKVIAHHCGSMVPFFAERAAATFDGNEMRRHYRHDRYLTKRICDYYRMFYVDTALQGNTPALMCGHSFFGADHLLFGTDAPYDSQLGERTTREAIVGIQQMDIPDAEKNRIFSENAKKLLRLPV